MKRQHKQSEVQPPLTTGDAQPDLAGRQTSAAPGPAVSDASALHPAHVVTLAAPEGDGWWDEEEPVARSGGVCLLIA